MPSKSHQRRAAKYRQKQFHDQRREDPSHAEFALRQAVDGLNLEVIGYEHRLIDDKSDRWFWFDVAVMYKSRPVFIDLLLRHKTGGQPEHYKELNAAKREVCERLGIPLLQLREEGAEAMQSKIFVWLFSL